MENRVSFIQNSIQVNMPKGKTTPENTWQRIEYWIKRNPDKTVEECQKLLDEKLKHHREAKPLRIEYWIKRNPDKTLEECQELLNRYKKENSFQCIEYWIKRNPDKTLEECQELLDNAKKSYLKKRPDNHGEKNPGHKSKVPLEERKRRSPMTIEFWKSRNPDKTLEECQKLLKEHKERLKKTHTPENTNTRIEYWLAKGYSEEEAKELLRNRQTTFTLQKCIDKYGKEEGEKIFNDRQKKWANSLKKNFEKYGDGRSPQSELASMIIDILCKNLEIEKPKKEKWMFDSKRNRAYAYDFQYKNKIIEINGDYWHANPKLYSAEFYNKSKQMVAEEIWLYDKLKYEFAESKGYSVYTIWESDWNEDPQRELNKCLRFLND